MLNYVIFVIQCKQEDNICCWAMSMTKYWVEHMEPQFTITEQLSIYLPENPITPLSHDIHIIDADQESQRCPISNMGEEGTLISITCQ